MKALLKIAIVGRPNVGKSSLMNALVRFRRAIVLDMPGTTRDEISETTDWGNGPVEVTDTYGVEERMEASELLPRLAKSDVILFVVDGSAGCTAADEEIGLVVRQAEKPTLLVVNKMDRPAAEGMGAFGALSIKNSVEVSVAHRHGMSELKDWLAGFLPAVKVKVKKDKFEEFLEPEVEEVVPPPVFETVLKIALVGKPNTGKSTLMNHLTGQQVSKVSPIPHTTRDTVAAEIETSQGKVRFLDTAGIRRARSIEEEVEVFSTQASRRAIKQADVVLLCLAIHEQVSDQDVRLLQLVQDAGRPTLVLLNFADRLTNKEKAHFIAESDFAHLLKGMPTLFISGATGENTNKILPQAWRMVRASNKRIGTSKLNSIVEGIIEKNPPPSRGLKNFNILYASQVAANPPTFVFFMNRKEALPDSYQRYLTAELKKRLNLKGQPVRLRFRARDSH